MSERAGKAICWPAMLLSAIVVSIAHGAERRPLPPVFAMVSDKVDALSASQGRELSKQISAIAIQGQGAM